MLVIANESLSEAIST